MTAKTWYLHVSGEAVGPLSTVAMAKMLQQNRCNAADYICCEGMGWTRIADCSEFTGTLPRTPEIATPYSAAPKTQRRPTTAAATPKLTPLATAPRPSAPIDAKVKINGGSALKVFELSETGLVFEKSPKLEIGADVKLRIESPSLQKPLDLTGILATETTHEGKEAMGLEFTRMNPAHRRAIAQYIAEHGGMDKAA